jgi:hypothetical protein
MFAVAETAAAAETVRAAMVEASRRAGIEAAGYVTGADTDGARTL